MITAKDETFNYRYHIVNAHDLGPRVKCLLKLYVYRNLCIWEGGGVEEIKHAFLFLIIVGQPTSKKSSRKSLDGIFC